MIVIPREGHLDLIILQSGQHPRIKGGIRNALPHDQVSVRKHLTGLMKFMNVLKLGR